MRVSNKLHAENELHYGGKTVGYMYHGYSDDNGKWHPSYRYNQCDIEFLESRNKGPLDADGNPITLASIDAKMQKLKDDWNKVEDERAAQKLLDEVGASEPSMAT